MSIEPELVCAITQSYATYARACDEKRYDLVAQVFAPDAHLYYAVAGHEFSCRGDEAAAYFNGFLERCYWTHHLIAPPMVERVNDHVRATARVTATHLQRRDDGSVNRWLVRGSYHDTYALRGAQWLIVRRDCYCLDADGDFENDGVASFPGVAWADRDVLG